jgi:hypothetical protein
MMNNATTQAKKIGRLMAQNGHEICSYAAAAEAAGAAAMQRTQATWRQMRRPQAPGGVQEQV